MNFNTKHIAILIISFFLIAGYSCKKDSHDTTSNLVLGYDYYPLEKGRYVIYNVEEIAIDVAVEKYDTIRYQLKELLADTVFSEDSTIARYKLERFIRFDTTKAWEIKNVWQIKQSRTSLIRVEENVPLVKQVYPMVVGQTWNINRFDTLPEKTNTLKSFDVIETINGKIFDKTAQMIQADDSSLIKKQYETEKYARGIGLVYKKIIDIESQSKPGKPVELNKPIMQRITIGTIVTWNIYSHN
jgi:hypothetical protein